MHKAKIKANMGAKKNGSILEDLGRFSSFKNNFAASAIGWSSPNTLTLLGPFRRWEYPKIFRSSNVKNAIAINVVIIMIKEVGIDKRSIYRVRKLKKDYVCLYTKCY
jgi:hypothetical protein